MADISIESGELVRASGFSGEFDRASNYLGEFFRVGPKEVPVIVSGFTFVIDDETNFLLDGSGNFLGFK